MEPLHYTTTLIDHSSATAFSALPDALVVPDAPAHVVAAGARLRLARSLHRLADALTPATPRSAWASSR